MQLDQDERGFSFMREGPLDMRMDPSSPLTAREVVNRWSEKDLGTLFREYGEERYWKQAAKAIVVARKKKTIETTTELADIISRAIRRSRPKLHPATLVFQALRVCVNGELDAIREGVEKAVDWLAPEGRMGVISFHRLEDRLVKNIFRLASKPLRALIDKKNSHVLPLLRLLTKKPLVPTRHECRDNKRARSAKLRAAAKL